jgi:hypothetical protein
VESLDAITADFLRGQELTVRGQELSLNAFNRLLAWQGPVRVPVPIQVQAVLMTQ